MKTLIKYLLAITLIGTSTATFAVTAGQEFERGVRAFSSGDLKGARSHFEAAKKAGLASPTLYYNLGVTYYRLRDYKLAREAFTELLNDRGSEALAAYNLGLIAAKQGDDAGARHWMERARDRATDQRLKGLAISALNTLNGGKGAALTTEKKWTTLISLGLGYDDQVSTLSATGVATGKGDSYAEAFAAANGVLTGRIDHGLQLGLNAYALRYASVSNYDLTLGRASLKWRQPVHDWRTESSLFVDTSRLGSIAYLNTTGINLSGSYDITPAMSTRLRYRGESIKAANIAYDYLTGTRHYLSAELRQRAADFDWRALVSVEANSRKDMATASYSPSRTGLQFEVKPHLSKKTDLSLGVALRNSAYPSVAGTARKDTQTQVKLGFEHELGDVWSLHGRYTYTDNNSNTTGYSYSRNLYTLSVSSFF